MYLFATDFRVPDWLPGRAPKQPEWTPELRAADLRGRLKKAESYCRECESRLTAYQARFQGPESDLLDLCLLEPDGPLALSNYRSEWYEMRRELSDFLERHRKFLQLLTE